MQDVQEDYWRPKREAPAEGRNARPCIDGCICQAHMGMSPNGIHGLALKR